LHENQIENNHFSEDVTVPSGGNSGLGEGSQLFKANGKYYLFNITWPKEECALSLFTAQIKLPVLTKAEWRFKI